MSRNPYTSIIGNTNLGFGMHSTKKIRKSIGSGKKTNIYADSGAKCSKCKHLLKGVKPHIHHKNHNPSDNRPSNLMLLCPNCHSKVHRKEGIRKVKPKNNSPWGNMGLKPIKNKPFQFI
jgi:5-methylcytosine-specific restriction endonuclease McrA